ncbi:MAG: acetate--CoA ligase family protein, partial [Syntrophales bacterium LBB04]|nr:acetate--CoA ligase family protein [Syntrophales bacterium LBB04]
CGRNLLHKTEAGLVELGLTDESLVRKSFEALWAKLPAGAEGVLVSKMVKGSREFIAGVAQDPQFGPVVMFGLGGIFAEAISDVVFRVVPILAVDAMEMMSDIKAHKLLGPIRGMPAVDKEALVNVLLGLSEAAATIPQIKEIDINPLLIVGDCPIAVDALIKLAG